MGHRLVPVWMRMRFVGIRVGVMIVLVVRIVAMAVFVRHRFMRVFVCMSLADVQPYAECH